MPFVYNPEVLHELGRKRRKLSHLTSMAQRQWENEEDRDDAPKPDDVPDQAQETAEMEEPVRTSSREELMECIKSGKSTVWVPSSVLERLAAERSSNDADLGRQTVFSPPKAVLHEAAIPPTLSRSTPGSSHVLEDPIERPRSALHAGDFRQDAPASRTSQRSKHSGNRDQNKHSPFDGFNGSEPPLWSASTPILSVRRFNTSPGSLASAQAEVGRRARAPSLGSSLSSSFVMRVPTSPLANTASHTSYDSDAPSISRSPDKTNRRRTLPPESIQSFQYMPSDQNAPDFSRPVVQPQMTYEDSFPARSHQPRRSLTSVTYQPASSNHIPPFLQLRRPSASSEISPRASMVGSFEESILRGRMSTAPSKPIDFIAQIGVLGKGNCKPSLRCPAHAIVPFPAVFYNYTSIPNSRSAADESPSPYVGSIDLEHHLQPIQPSRRHKQSVQDARDSEELMAEIVGPETTATGRALARDAVTKNRRNLLQAPLGGCYRLPQEGQLQIIIKNPNKTAVKLYLIPYDLTGMEPHTKTFIRQRSYSAGPILDKPISADVQSQQKFDSLQDKHILRYLIHLKICCLSKDRFYLYDNIRVVFANRVPDGKEKLRNETQLPHPKYSPYKPGKDGWRSTSETCAGQTGSHQISLRGTPASFQPRLEEVESMPLFVPTERGMPLASLSTSYRYKVALFRTEPSIRHAHDPPPVPQVHFQFRDTPRPQTTESEHMISPKSGFQVSTSTRSSPVAWESLENRHGPRSFSPAPVLPESGDGLLSRKLRGLSEDVSGHNTRHD